MTDRLLWERDGVDWPNRESSRFVEAGGLMWHVQQMGQGPVLLLLHGTGASTHSWRDLAPRLAVQFTVIAPDLPGHGFTAMPTPAQLSLAGMAHAVADLVDALGLTIAGAVGHSAGAAIALQMVFDRRISPQVVMGMNAALLPLDGAARVLFPPAARLMAATSLAPRLFAWRASDRTAVARLIDGTGSALDERGLALYGRLVADVKHVSAALGMMARWNLEDLESRLRDLEVPLSLLVGARDRAVPPAHARRVLAALPLTTPATLTVLEGLGHLAHEEQPEAAARFVVGAMEANEPRVQVRAAGGRS